jgi:uncharacterized protein YndB with AHSA1/START domain
MSVVDLVKDPVSLTMTVTTEFAAEPDRIWQLWADPRQLERWWGPPGYPATFVEHTLVPGAMSRYYMTTPEGETPRGWWRIISAEAPGHIEIEDGFADERGEPVPDMPAGRMIVTIEPLDTGRTRMTLHNVFPSSEAMEQVLAMGMEEGMRQALNQIDGLLAAG